MDQQRFVEWIFSWQALTIAAAGHVAVSSWRRCGRAGESVAAI